LTQLINLSDIKNIIAAGEKSYSVSSWLGVESTKIRHPANGGATPFKKQFNSAIQIFSN